MTNKLGDIAYNIGVLLIVALSFLVTFGVVAFILHTIGSVVAMWANSLFPEMNMVWYQGCCTLFILLMILFAASKKRFEVKKV